MIDKLMNIEDAIAMVKDGDTIWINSFSAVASPVELNIALTQRFRATGGPVHLSVYSPFSFSDWREDSDVEGYICEGALDPAAADFSPMVKQSASSPGIPVWVEKASHAARVMVDEEGCVAAAYTVIGASGGSAAPSETVDFTLDRPFLFAIVAPDTLPLFVGIVNNPAG